MDLTNSVEFTFLQTENNQLESLFVKNGYYYTSNYDLQNNPNLQYICADETDIVYLQNIVSQLGYNCTVNSYCSFTPGGEFYTINGNNTFDANANGCDTSDENLPNLKFNITNGTQTGSIIANQSGEYSIPVQVGNHTITPILENPALFTISPATVSVTFPTTISPFTQNFCITPNGLHPDLEVAILPTTPARPGFDAEYTILIKNKGNIQQSGSVSFAYDDAILDYEIATPVFTTQAEGLLSWTFADLQPFETREINLTLNVNSPMETPAVNGDDVLTYTATITSDQTDELPLDNTFSLPQIVVNSFDPNDKTCLEGTAISPYMIGQYVHY
ncbi:MAG: T9SS C-terminal target domain-containing protein, partial [Chitinophagaceae bacterium]